MQKHCINNIVQ
uniref:Uncharacterized protein n=1 Tax=Rhizophora mucronata TaxID=61149 RepID=A0A2P2QJZ4_RHIMU